MTKKIQNIVEEVEAEEPTEELESKVESKVESAEKIVFRAFIEKYKKQNPIKYKSKKVELENKLNNL